MKAQQSLGVILLAGSALAAVGCKHEAAQTGATVDRIKANPNAYYGQQVTLAGEVDSVFGLRAFELENNDLFDNQVLVLARSDMQPGGQSVSDDQRVRVTGVVRPMVVAEVEREVGWDLSPQIEAEFSTRPVVVATSVELVDRPEARWTEAVAPATATAQTEPIMDLSTIVQASDRKTLVDREARMQGVKVLDVISDRAFWIGSDEQQRVLVVLDEEPKTPGTPIEGKVNVNKGQTVNLTGTVKRAPSVDEAKRLWKLPDPAKVLANREIYLQALRVDVVQRPSAAGRRPADRR